MASGRDIRAGAAYIELYTKDSALVRGLARAQRKLKAFGASARRMGMELAKLSAVLATPLVAGVKSFADFERQMANVSTMLDAPEKYMDSFRKGILDMSVEFGESTETLAKGLYDILSASVPAEKAMGVLEASARAAQAGLTDTGVAADAITTILNAYGLSADNAGQVSDLLFSIVKRGKTTFGQLAPSIGMVATTAATAGVSLEEMGAALATMTRNGVNTDNAVTALTAIVSSFLKPSSEAVKTARALGFEMSSATLQSEGLAGVFARISKLPPDAIAKLFPNIRALRGVLPALGNMEGFLGDIAVMGDRAGTTEEAYAKMTGTLSHSLRQLKASAMATLVAIGAAIAGPVAKAAKAVKRWLGMLRTFIENNKEVVITAAKVVAIVAGVAAALITLGVAGSVLAFVFGGIASIISGAVTVLGLIASAVAALLSPVGLVIAAIVALGAYIVYATGAGAKALSWLSEKFQGLKSDALAAWQGIGDALAAGDISLAAKILWLTLKMEWQKGVKWLEEKWIAFKRRFLEIATAAFYGTLELLTVCWAGLKSAWVETTAFMGRAWAKFTGLVRKSWNTTQGWLAKRWIDLMGLFDDTMDVAEVKRSIDEDTGRLNTETDRQEQADVAAIEGKREADRARIENERDESLVGLDRSERDANRKRNTAYEKQLAESEAELAKTRKEWQEALAAAKAGRGAATTGEDGAPSVEDYRKKLASAGDMMMGAMTGEVTGTFSAAALGRMGFGSSVAERTARASEETAKNTSDMNRKIDDLGLAFE